MVLRYITGSSNGPSCGPYEEKIRSVRDGLRIVTKWFREQELNIKHGNIYYIPRWAIVNNKGEVVLSDCDGSDLYFLQTGNEKPSWY